MLLLQFLVTAALAWSSPAACSPLEQLATGRTSFSLEQVPVIRATPWSPPHAIRKTYQKYGAEVPSFIEEAVKNAEAMMPPGQTSVSARPIKGETEFLIQVQVGTHNLSLDLDTGSSDLWVLSTLLPNDQRSNRPNARVYDPRGSNAKRLDGHSWQVRYGDSSSASGQVFLDKVTVGDLTVANQAVEAAASVSRTFVRDEHIDGLLGLAFSRLNTVKPTPQKTWFDNVRVRLAAPVFCASLKRRQTGTYDFGYIDKNKYRGDIVWVPVKGARGFWDFDPSGYAIGNGEVRGVTIHAIADTGSSLWYLPRAVTDAYYAQVPGASYNALSAGYTFPCTARLPDITLIIAGKRVTVAGSNIMYQNLSPTTCFGGIQRDTGMPYSIFGDVFLKGLYVIFEQAPNGSPRLGFAQPHR